MRSPFRRRVGAIAATPQTPPALRADAARNRELIIAAATEVFAERGLEASTAEIAQRAGVGEATLFRRFASKEELVDAILDQRMAESIELIADCAAESDPWRAIERFFTEIIESKLQSDLAFLEASHDRCMSHERFAPQRTQALELTSQMLRRAQKAGVVRDDLQPQDLNFLLMAAIGPLLAPMPGLRADLWKRYVGIILDGIRPEGATKLRPPAPPRKLVEHPQS